MMDKNEIATLREKLRKVKEDEENEEALLADLKRRLIESQYQVDRLAIEVEREGEMRMALLKAVALGEKTEKDVAALSKKIDDLKRAFQDAVDLNEMFRKTIPELERKLTELGKKVQGCQHEFWFAISEYEASKLKEVEGPLLRSWTAFLMAGCAPNLGPFLQNRFANFKWDVTRVEADLEKEYIGVGGGEKK